MSPRERRQTAQIQEKLNEARANLLNCEVKLNHTLSLISQFDIWHSASSEVREAVEMCEVLNEKINGIHDFIERESR